jgi:hypothetical protein
VPPHVDNVADEDVAEALAALGWQPAELDPALPPRVAYAAPAISYSPPRLVKGWPTSTTTSHACAP